MLTVVLQELIQHLIMAYYSEDNKLYLKKNVFDHSLKLRVMRNTFVDTLNRWELMRHQAWNTQINGNQLAQIAGLNKDCVTIEEINK
jgi:hypothetical protein